MSRGIPLPSSMLPPKKPEPLILNAEDMRPAKKLPGALYKENSVSPATRQEAENQQRAEMERKMTRFSDWNQY